MSSSKVISAHVERDLVLEMNMSSTWVSGMSAAACVDSGTGTIYYLLSEQTAESNVHPRRPHWSARFFGTAPECMAAIVRWSSGCEGGCTKGGNGRDMTPSGYIGKWREAMSLPVVLPKGEVRAKFGTGFYDISPELKSVVSEVLTRHGLPDVQGEEMRVDMDAPKALPALVELLRVGYEKGLYTWRLWSYVDSVTARRPELGVSMAKAKGAKVEGVRVWRIKQSNDDEFLVAFGDEKPRMTGWHYSLIQTFIIRAVVPAEMEQPGVAESLIRAFRKFVDDAPVVSTTVPIVISMPSGVEIPSYQKRELEKLRATLGLPDLPSIQTTMGKIEAAGGTWSLRHMAPSMVEFQLDDQHSAMPEDDVQNLLRL
jgi:hypothetical protein